MTGKKSTDSAPKGQCPEKGKWVFCYLPSVGAPVKIVGQTHNYWVVDHKADLVVKCACSTPSSKAKAVRNPRGST